MAGRSFIIMAGIIAVILIWPSDVSGQERESINWISFEALEDSLKVKPKKVFIKFYTDWCTYCRKMDKVVFTKDDVIEVLNEKYYSIDFNAESSDTINFGGRVLINDQLKTSRTPLHQIAQLLAIKDDRFVPPTMVLLDEEFRVTSRYFEYMDSKRLLKAINQP